MCVCVCAHTMCIYIHTHSGILRSHSKKEILLFATIQVDLEGIVPSEISQTEKDKYYMISLTYGILEIDGETIETVTDFIFLGSKITTVGDCSHEIKRCLLLGRKAMRNLGSIFKSRDITLPTKVHKVKAMVFPVVMYGCESWTIKKAEHGRIDAFELWCSRRLLRVPWTAVRSNQSILRKSVLNIHWKD